VVNLFGNKDALIGSMELLFGAVFVLGAFIFRKSVANDMLDREFSVIGSSALGILTFLILDVAINLSLKFCVGLGLIAWAVGGFLLAPIIGDGEA